MSKVLDDLFEKGQELVADRAKSKFGGPYLFSWIVCNHGLLIVIFNDEDYARRINSLLAMFPHTMEGYLGVFGVPLGLAAAYVFITPTIELLVRSGVAVADCIWRFLRGRVFKIGWYSSSEVEKIRSDCDSKVAVAAEKVKQAHEREAVASSLMSTNKERFEQLQQKYLKQCSLSLKGIDGHMIDPNRVDDLLRRFPSATNTIQDIKSRGFPYTVFSTLVHRVVNEDLNPLSLYLSHGSYIENDQLAAYSLETGVCSVVTGLDYSTQVRLTEFGAALVDEVYFLSPHIAQSDRWRAQVEQKRLFAALM